MPTYLELADELELDVLGSEPDERVPSEHDIVRRHQVSRVTARSALQELERRHLVRRVRGRGTFVARRLEYVVGPSMAPSWSATVRAAGAEPGSELLSVTPAVCDAERAGVLEIDEGAPTIELRRRGSVDGLVATSSVSVVPRRWGDAVEHAAAGGSLYDGFRRAGLDVARAWSCGELVTPPAEVAAELGHEGRPPTWFLESVNRDRPTGRIVEYARTWLRADVFRIRFVLGPEPTPDPPAAEEAP
ncbi:MAG: GntR family transcriptional regulator [Actinomycetota bacterium]